MIVKLYTTNDKNIKVRKTLTNKGMADCKILQPVSIINPTLILTGYSDRTINYAYIEEYKRYYYIVNYSVNPNGFIVLSLKCDVLMSFIDDIANNDCIVSRNQYDYNFYLQDNLLQVQNNPIITTRQFPAGFPAPQYVLITNTTNMEDIPETPGTGQTT